MGDVSMTDDLADLAAFTVDFSAWHIWRGRSTSGRETDWHATGRTRVHGKIKRPAEPDACGLRVLLAQDEPLGAVAA